MEITESIQKKQRTNRNTKRTVKVTTEREDLGTHVDLCVERYNRLNEKFDELDRRVDGIAMDIKEIRTTASKNFDEIKGLLTQAKDEKFKVMLATAGSVIVALIGMFGYLINKVG